MVGYETTSKLFFQSIHWAIPISVTNNPRVRSKRTPYVKHQSTLMSPRYSNVTTSICGFDYMICITQSQIHLFKPTQRTSKSAPKFLPESQNENVCQPLCIGSWAEPASWSPKHTSSGSREYPIVTTDKHDKTYIKCSQILKDSIR